MPYRLAIFDFDGTLADSFAWFIAANNEAAGRFGFRRIEPEDAERLRGMDAREVIRHVGLPMWKVPALTRHMRRRMTEDAGGISLFAGVDGMLEGLASRGVTLAIVTSNAEPNVRRVLGPRLASLVRHYECGASLFGKRPKLRKVLLASGVPAAGAIAIGDEIRDLNAARAEGIPFGAVGWGFTRLESLAALSPDEVFTRVEEIVERVA